jgi:hypothetical protein
MRESSSLSVREQSSTSRSGEPVVNPLHNSLRPLDTCSDQLVRPWASLWTSKQIVRRLHMQTREDRGHHSDHAFAAFVHVLKFITFALYSPTSLCHAVTKARQSEESR